MIRLITVIVLSFMINSANGQNLNVPKHDSILLSATFEKQDTFQYFSIIDTGFTRYRLPNSFKKPKTWRKADMERTKPGREPFNCEYPDSFELRDALALIDTARDMSICSAKYWCIDNYQVAFPYLVARLSDKRKVGLEKNSLLMIFERYDTGELKPFSFSHAYYIVEDLFTIAGRASWILNELTGEGFATVQGNLTLEEAVRFKEQWIKYIKRLK